jgi:hypothetical protein
MGRANARIGVDGGHGSPRVVDALMKGKLNSEGERISRRLAIPMLSPNKGCRIFEPRTLTHINARAPEVS